MAEPWEFSEQGKNLGQKVKMERIAASTNEVIGHRIIELQFVSTVP